MDKPHSFSIFLTASIKKPSWSDPSPATLIRFVLQVGIVPGSRNRRRKPDRHLISQRTKATSKLESIHRVQLP